MLRRNPDTPTGLALEPPSRPQGVRSGVERPLRGLLSGTVIGCCWPVTATGLVYAKLREGTAGAATTAPIADAGQLLLSRIFKGSPRPPRNQAASDRRKMVGE